MRSVVRILVIIACLSTMSFGCRQEKLSAPDTSVRVVSNAPGTSNNSDYAIALEVTKVTDGYSWKYTLTKQKGAKDLSYFLLNLGSCGESSPEIGSIRNAKVNGADWMAHITAANGNNQCSIDTSNFVKFENLGAASQYIIEFTLDTLYSEVNALCWLKAGTSCLEVPVLAPGCKGYQLTTSMTTDSAMVGKPYSAINTYMKTFGFDYSEHPSCSGGYGGHPDGIHCDTEWDSFLKKYVFRFNIHIDPVIDGDRCSAGTVDRQRNEMKSATNNTTWAKVQGNWDEWQRLEWKFKLPAGFQPTTSFCHIHQLKAQDGPYHGSPLITITPRSDKDGSHKRIQIIHSVDGASTGKGKIVDNIPLADFEDQWVQVQEEMHYTHHGYYSCKITRVSDGKVLIDFKDDNIDMWRKGSSYIRNKYGIYRSLAGGKLDQTPVGQSPLLKNESLWLTDFKVYEKNPNPDPGTPHD